MQQNSKKLKKARTLLKENKAQRALDLYIEVLKTAPSDPEANYYMGVLCRDSQRFEQAARHLSISSNTPEFQAKSFFALSRMYKSTNVNDRYIEFALRTFLAEPENADYAYSAASALNYVHFNDADPQILAIILQMLQSPHINHDTLFIAWFSLFKKTDEFASLISLSKETGPSSEHINSVVDTPAVILPICQILVQERELEDVLTRVRRSITLGQQHHCISLAFLVALALQGFHNDYVWQIEKDEHEIINCLSEAPSKNLHDLMLIAAYRPLITLSDVQNHKTLIDSDASGLALHVWTQQVEEPLREKEIKATIPSFTEVADEMSQRVQAQYEQNPYPRWNALGAANPLSFKTYLQRLFPFWPNEFCAKLPTKPKVLIAGCGTGRQALELAAFFPELQITAIDITLSSLAYAIRKQEELGIQKIDFGQADILKLDETFSPGTFDVIYCTGVLHHMQDPVAGWKKLAALLKPSGLMYIALYSAIARKSVHQMRAIIAEKKLTSSAEDIRRMRQIMKEMDAENEIGWLISSKDFYTTSDCRDLLFHVNEHQYTLTEIAEVLEELGFEFLGFDNAAKPIEKRLHELYPHEPLPGQLKLWDEMERTYPDSFTGMYQFVIRKKPQ